MRRVRSGTYHRWELGADMHDLHNLAERARSICASVAPRVALGMKVRNADDDRAEVLIYDMIGDYGVTAADFVTEFRQVKASKVDVRINSGGGDVFDAVAIHSALSGFSGEVTTWVDGVAASAASFIAQAGKTRMIGKYAKMMIHNASGLVAGNAKDMRQMADILDEISATMADLYADRSGRPTATFAKAMDAETWYSATDAVDAGLADAVDAPAETGTEAANARRSQLIRARARLALRRE